MLAATVVVVVVVGDVEDAAVVVVFAAVVVVGGGGAVVVLAGAEVVVVLGCEPGLVVSTAWVELLAGFGGMVSPGSPPVPAASPHADKIVARATLRMMARLN